MAQLTEQQAALGGITPTYAAVAAADFFIPAARGVGAKYLIHIKNAGASPDSFVIDDPNTPSPSGATAYNPDVTVSVTNATERMILLDNVDRFVDPTTGRINFTNSFITSVTIGIFRVGL